MAAGDYINLALTDNAAKYAQDVKTLVRLAKEFSDGIDRVVARGFHIIGTAPDVSFTEFETLHGLAEGQGQTVFDLLNGCKLAISGQQANSKIEELRDRVG